MSPREPESPRLPTLVLFYLVMALVFAGDLLAPGRSLFRWDTLIYTWPMVQEARAQLLAGHWPFWAASFCCGTPLLENINAGVFYPMKLLVYFLPLKFGYQLFLFVHVWLTFLFTHLFLQRGLRLRPLAAVIGALAFGASGYMRSMWDTHNFYAMPWIPLALYVAASVSERRAAANVSEPKSVRSRSQPRTVIFAMAGCFVMLIYGGDLEQAILTVPAVFLLILLQEFSTTESTEATEKAKKSKLVSVLSVFSVVGIGILLGLMLSAPQLLPAWDWSHYSYRAAGMPLAEAAERSFHPARLIELLIPHFYGTRDGWFGEHLAYGTKTTPWVSSFHIGLVPFLLAIFALLRLAYRRHSCLRSDEKSGDRNVPATGWALSLFTGGVLLAVGGFIPPLFKLVHALPLLGSFRYPEKYLLWATLGLATLAAIGTDIFVRSAPVRAFRKETPDGVATNGWTKLGLFAFCLISVLLPWYKELPTTNKFDPLDTPQFLIPIINSDDPQGRIFVDPAVKDVPLPPDFSSLRPSERQAIYYRERLEFNAPRLWGCRTAGGFSPAEARNMYAARTNLVTGEDVAGFCVQQGVRWLVTPVARLQALSNRAVVVAEKVRWGDTNGLALVTLVDAREAGTDPPSVALPGSRPWAGSLRWDLGPGGAGALRLRESNAAGWRYTDQDGQVLRVSDVVLPSAHDFLMLPRGTIQVRASYEPPWWRASLFVALAGSMATLGLLLSARSRRRSCTASESGRRAGDRAEDLSPTSSPSVAEHPLLPGKPAGGGNGKPGSGAWTVFICCLAFIVISLAARSHWGCTFDEGFHLTRGLALRHFDDARLSYFHPPLQNALGGYFAGLAFGDRLKFPVTDALKRGDALTYATEFARANGDVFNEAVRASRWASMLFGLLLVAVGVWWARSVAAGVSESDLFAHAHSHVATREREPEAYLAASVSEPEAYVAASVREPEADVAASVREPEAHVAASVSEPMSLPSSHCGGGTGCSQQQESGRSRSQPHLAGWLAGIGLALNPNLIAHGNLNTTDMGVTALVVTGTVLLWRAVRSSRRGGGTGCSQSQAGPGGVVPLLMAAVVFALAAMTKFTGLIWLGSLLVLVVPLLAWRWRDRRALLAIPVGLAAFFLLLVVFYGSPDRFFAGLSAQTGHAFSGHKAWFHGQFFERSSWWHMPAAIVLKAPEVWLIGVMLALYAACSGSRRPIGGSSEPADTAHRDARLIICRRTCFEDGAACATTSAWLPLLPAAVFAFLLFFVNNMAIGVRHALPLVALGTIAGAVAIARIGARRWRRVAAGLFAAGTIFAAGSSFPHYLAYFPAWAGGVEHGHRWLVDSNYDWGQGLDELESQWAELTAENGGEPPNLVYYGFSDPRVTHRLRVGPHSYCGFMDVAAEQGRVSDRLAGAEGLLVVSISAPPLRPHGLRLDVLRNAEFIRRVGTCFEVFRVNDGAAPTSQSE